MGKQQFAGMIVIEAEAVMDDARSDDTLQVKLTLNCRELRALQDGALHEGGHGGSTLAELQQLM